MNCLKDDFMKAMETLRKVQQYCKSIEYVDNDDQHPTGHCINCMFGTGPCNCSAADQFMDTAPCDWWLS